MIAPLAYLYVLLALLAVPNWAVAAKNSSASSSSSASSDGPAETPSSDTPIDFLNDGVLLVSGKQTSCELVLLSNQHGLIAANCLLTSDNQAISLDQLEIATHGSATSEAIAINATVTHPQFGPQTLANNIALVSFTTEKDKIESSKAPVNTT
ncbi:hypothetical protein LPJ70_005473, partial [Coemansia sp. RSA 2708]